MVLRSKNARRRGIFIHLDPEYRALYPITWMKFSDKHITGEHSNFGRFPMALHVMFMFSCILCGLRSHAQSAISFIPRDHCMVRSCLCFGGCWGMLAMRLLTCSFWTADSTCVLP